MWNVFHDVRCTEIPVKWSGDTLLSCLTWLSICGHWEEKLENIWVLGWVRCCTSPAAHGAAQSLQWSSWVWLLLLSQCVWLLGVYLLYINTAKWYWDLVTLSARGSFRIVALTFFRLRFTAVTLSLVTGRRMSWCGKGSESRQAEFAASV